METGTSLGDPIEVHAIGAVFARTHDADNPLLLGSVKANVGHTEGAAGVASLMKTVLALEHREIPPNIHFKNPNPHISWKDLPVDVPATKTSWLEKDGTRIAGISAFGFSGTNVHLLVQQAPEGAKKSLIPERPLHVLPVSAKSEAALREQAGRLSAYVEASTEALPDICHTAGAGRSHFAHRLSIVAGSKQDLSVKLKAFCAAEESPGIHHHRISAAARSKVAFLFTGQGSHYPNMGRELYKTEPIFRRTLQQCDALLKAETGDSILHMLYGRADSCAGLEQSQMAQPLLFAFGYAMAQMWMSWGIQPAAVMGHSLGEYIAACVAGVFSLEDGLKLVAARGRLTQAAACCGEMFAVASTETAIQPYLLAHSGKVSIAAFNGPENLLLAGPLDEMAALFIELNVKGFRTKKLRTQNAFHCSLMDPFLDEFEAVAQTISYQAARIPFVSNLTGRALISTEIADALHWRLHLRQPVRFDAGMNALVRKDCSSFLEIGPGATLLGMASDHLAAEDRLWVPSLRQSRGDWEQVLDTMGALYTRGFPVDWKAFDRGRARVKVELPSYPFERQRFWFEGKPQAKAAEPETSALEQWREWLYDVEWVPAPDAAAQVIGEPGNWLVLADRTGVGEELSRLLTAQGDSAELLYEPASMAELQTAVHRWTAQGGQGVVHLWSLDAADRSLEPAQKSILETLLSALQALVGQDTAGMWAVTMGAQSVLPTDSLSPVQSLTWGFGKTAVLEHPEIWRGLIDLGGGEPAAAQAAVVFREIRRPQRQEDQVASRNGARFVPRLVSAQAKALSSPAFRAKPDSAYLIAGGLGKLGLKLAKWLAGLGAKHLVLTGRRGLAGASAHVTAIVEALRSSGARVDVLPVDISSEAQMRSLGDHLRQNSTRLGGIIAAAASFSRVPLATADYKSMGQLLASKVTGTWLLSELAREFDPDIFVLFSSITSSFGTLEAAHYAAASQFQDTFAIQRRQTGKHALSINWGLWEETGADHESNETFRLSGNRAMETKEALAALEYLLAADETRKTVASIDWSVLRPLYETRKKKPFLERMGTPSAVAYGEAALRARFFAAQPEDRQSVIQTCVAGVVAGIVGLPKESISVEMNFAQIGMDSLMASAMRNRLQTEAGLGLPNTLSYDFPTVRTLSLYLQQRLNASIDAVEDASRFRIAPAIRTVPRKTFPLSSPQEIFWFLYRDNVAFNVPLPYRLVGRLDVAAAEKALAEIARRHEALRTTFETIDGAPMQIISETAVGVAVALEDLSALARERREAEIQSRVAKYSETSFDLKSGPLLKVWILQASETDWVLLFVAHHIVFDAWSMQLLAREFEVLYNAFVLQQASPLAPLEIQYVDYSEWQRNHTSREDSLRYWQEQFGAGLPALPFPIPEGSDAISATGEKFRTVLPAALIDRLKLCGGESSHTLFTLLFTAFGMLVHKYSGQEEIFMMSAGAGRHMHQMENLIGMFAAPLLVRARFFPNLAFSGLLEQVHESFRQASSHDFPVRQLLGGSVVNEAASSRKLSQAFFDSLPDVPVSLQLEGLERAEYFPTERQRMRHDLEIYFRPVPQGVYCAVWCNRSLFDPSAPQKIMGDLTRLLQRIIEGPDVLVSELLQGISTDVVRREEFSGAAAND